MLNILVFMTLNCSVFCEVAHREALVLFTNNPFFDAEGDAEKMIPKTVTWPVGRRIESEHRVVPTYSYINLLLWPFESDSAASWALRPLRVLGRHVS